MYLKPKKKKNLSIENSNYYSNHFAIYTHIKSACTTKTNTTVRCKLYLSKTGGGQRILYPTNVFFENESKIKIFPDEQRIHC